MTGDLGRLRPGKKYHPFPNPWSNLPKNRMKGATRISQSENICASRIESARTCYALSDDPAFVEFSGTFKIDERGRIVSQYKWDCLCEIDKTG